MEKVTACLIVKNEETNIGECLKSLSFVDEIIVVDSGSIDKTIEIAKQYTKNVYKKEWLGFANQRNYAASLATSEWILAIDADERISKELSAEIVNILVAPKHDVYDIPMTNFVINRWMKFGKWQDLMENITKGIKAAVMKIPYIGSILNVLDTLVISVGIYMIVKPKLDTLKIT
jgi:glycosyltransferase involved in cell wall biosynthesis